MRDGPESSDRPRRIEHRPEVADDHHEGLDRALPSASGGTEVAAAV